MPNSPPYPPTTTLLSPTPCLISFSHSFSIFIADLSKIYPHTLPLSTKIQPTKNQPTNFYLNQKTALLSPQLNRTNNEL